MTDAPDLLAQGWFQVVLLYFFGAVLPVIILYKKAGKYGQSKVIGFAIGLFLGWIGVFLYWLYLRIWDVKPNQ